MDLVRLAGLCVFFVEVRGIEGLDWFVLKMCGLCKMMMNKVEFL